MSERLVTVSVEIYLDDIDIEDLRAELDSRLGLQAGDDMFFHCARDLLRCGRTTEALAYLSKECADRLGCIEVTRIAA